MSVKDRVRIGLIYVLISFLAALLVPVFGRPHGLDLSLHYLLARLWPLWYLGVAPIMFVFGFFLASLTAFINRINPSASPKQSPEKP